MAGYATHGSTVTVSYIGTLENGRIFHSTDEHGPLVFTIGKGEVFAALEQAVTGMKVMEVRNIVLAPEQAYGPRLQENIIRVNRQLFPAEKEIVPGQKISMTFSGGASRVMVVIAADGQEVTLDGNHPLAGCELTFALRLDNVSREG